MKFSKEILLQDKIQIIEWFEDGTGKKVCVGDEVCYLKHRVGMKVGIVTNIFKTIVQIENKIQRQHESVILTRNLWEIIRDRRLEHEK